MKKMAGIVATAAAVAFITAPVASTLAHADHHKVACYGVNACKGKSSCKTSTSACKGNNGCKGKGVVMTSAKNCTKLGGTTTAPKS